MRQGAGRRPRPSSRPARPRRALRPNAGCGMAPRWGEGRLCMPPSDEAAPERPALRSAQDLLRRPLLRDLSIRRVGARHAGFRPAAPSGPPFRASAARSVAKALWRHHLDQERPEEPHAAGRSQAAAPFVWVVIPDRKVSQVRILPLPPDDPSCRSIASLLDP
jgi:hypothetical protein